ncbi:hypothetical protein Hanom_Chr07g00599211 [Helianthus anomalus]
MDGVNKPDENGKISNLLDPDAEKQTFGKKSQNWPNLKDENSILLSFIALLFLPRKLNLTLLFLLKFLNLRFA